MDIDKSLYMKDFLKLRSTLGCVFNREARSVLHTNLYDEFLPRKVKTEVAEVVEEIQEKTIQILDKGQLEAKENTKQEQDKKGDTLVLFEDAVDKPVEEDVSDDVGDDVGDDDVSDDVGAEEPSTNEDGKSKNETLPVPNVDLLGGGKQLKKIVINPNYVAVDS
tara:strand:+ start:297 stop:788 length:492 start_codon:yes stop_codon:yes gene_type:complete